MMNIENTIRPEPVEGLSFLFGVRTQEGQGFDRLSPNGFVSHWKRA
jgi:hypothetical protein